MTKNFIKKTAVVAITIVIMVVSTISAKGQCSNAGTSVACNVTNFWIGTTANGDMCADFNITLTCNANCRVSVSGTVTFYECGNFTAATAVTYPFRGNDYGWYWDFYIDFGGGNWVLIPFNYSIPPTPSPSTPIVTIRGQNGPITCDLARIGLIPGGTYVNSPIGDIQGLLDDFDFLRCYTALGCW